MHRILLRQVHPAGLLLVDILVGVETLDLGGDPCGKGRGVKLGNRADTRISRDEIFPEKVEAVADRGNDSDTGNHAPAVLLIFHQPFFS